MKSIWASVIFATILMPSLASAQMFGFRPNQLACNAYSGLLKSAGFTNRWKLDETSGSVAADSLGTNTGTYINSPALGVPGPLMSGSKGAVFNGSSQSVQTSTLVSNPTSLTLIIWFKTGVPGGKLIGFGSSPSGGSSSYDRHIYMSNTGAISFGVYNGSTNVITSSASYSDNQWHMAAATFGPSGERLLIDGSVIGVHSNTTVTGFDGYFRIAYDTADGWPSANGNYFSGALSEAAIHVSGQVSNAKIQELYGIGKKCKVFTGSPSPVIVSASYGGDGLNCDATSAVISVCAGQASCTVGANNGLCGDPAGGVTKNLTISYTCSGISKSASAVEGSSISVSCP
jgi:hypothetical protein